MRLPLGLSLSLICSASLFFSCSSGSGAGGKGGAGGSSAAGTSGGGGPGAGGSGVAGSGAGGSGVAGSDGGAGSGSGVAGSGAGGSGVAGSGVGGSAVGGSGVAGSGAGGSGTGGSSTGSGFPTQACIDKANALLAQMTNDEKAAQTIQPERAQISNAQVTQYAPGSVYSQGGSAPTTNTPQGWADMINGYRAASRTSAHKIPIIYGLDSVHGLGPVVGATIFPHNVGLGATGDPALVQQVAQTVSDESSGVGADFPFAPVIAVGRDERWGRTYEAYAETPDLVSTMGVAMVKGLQFPTGGSKISILANIKHYLGDGGTVGGVTGGNTSGDETTLRALHLAPYQATVAARAGSVMLSYSSWQGTKMHINKSMVTDVLKGQLAFGGFVGTDYNGCAQVNLSFQDGMAACLNAGADMFMIFSNNSVPPNFGSGTTVQSTITNLVAAGTVPQARLDDAVRRILAVKCEMGLFDSTGVIDTAATARVGSAAHRMVARQAVQKSMVVLKNSGILPLSKSATVALAGNSAYNSGNQCGGWTITWQGGSTKDAMGNTVPGVTTIKAAMEAEVGTAKVVYSADGSSRTGATVGVAVIGEIPYSEGTGDVGMANFPDLSLSRVVAPVMALKAAGLPVVVVLIAGRPMILDAIMPYADAIVMAWLPGSEGAGVTDILYGDVKPTGKLPMTWPKTMSQIPINQGDATYDPLYAYGFGLTY
jgi:beta-glucosidase